ncbi:MAG: hypothetical protein ACJ72E_11185 [Marmoricola sp.]
MKKFLPLLALVLAAAVTPFLGAPAQAAGVTSQTVSITSAAPTGDAAIFDRVDGLGNYVPTGTSTSGLPVIFSVTSPDEACFSIPGSIDDPGGTGVITIFWNSPGECIVHANQPGDDTYAAATEATQTIHVLGESTFIVAKGAKGAFGTAPSTFKGTLYQNFQFGPGVGSQPVQGATLTFAVGGTVMCSATTNSEGVATCKKAIGLQKWLTSKNFSVSFAGSQFLQPTTIIQKWG